MPETIWWIIGIIYIVVFSVFVGTESHIDKNVARKGALWPIVLTYFVIKGCIGLMNELMHWVLLITGFDYKKTGVYTLIDTWAWEGI